MTDNFLIMLDTYGKIKFFYLPESTLILEYKPDVIIARVKIYSKYQKNSFFFINIILDLSKSVRHKNSLR